MRKLLLALALVSCAASASEPLWKKLYVRADGGMGVIQKTKYTDYKNSAIYGMGVGINLNEMFRFDLDYNQRNIRSKLKNLGSFLSKNVDSKAVFLNGYFNLSDFKEMTPYVTVGVGYASNKTNDSVLDQNDLRTSGEGQTSKHFVWNVGVGTTYALNNNVNLDFGYRFVSLGDMKFKQISKKIISTNTPININLKPDEKNILSHELLIGLTFKF